MTPAVLYAGICGPCHLPAKLLNDLVGTVPLQEGCWSSLLSGNAAFLWKNGKEWSHPEVLSHVLASHTEGREVRLPRRMPCLSLSLPLCVCPGIARRDRPLPFVLLSVPHNAVQRWCL